MGVWELHKVQCEHGLGLMGEGILASDTGAAAPGVALGAPPSYELGPPPPPRWAWRPQDCGGFGRLSAGQGLGKQPLSELELQFRHQ